MNYCAEKIDLLCENVSVGENGHLLFAGQDTVSLAAKYGTPLYLMDEDRIRERCRIYKKAVSEAFADKGLVLYASKAASFKRIYEIMNDEGMGIDVVSSGEICTALKAGFPIEKAFFHSNNKTDADINYAIENGIGYFVVDNAEELFAIDRIAASKGVTQKVLLRITPGIDPHTFAAVSTGKVDSKFGSAIETGQAAKIVKTALSLENICLEGFHCHIGSQVFESDIYLKAADVMLTFFKDMKASLGLVTKLFDIGGGFGVRYIAEHGHVDIEKNISEIGEFIKNKVNELGIEMPTVAFEPGRSIVADAGMTLYTAGTVKKIPEFINYVSVDGGMTDNVRFAMYSSPYTLFAANKMNEGCDMLCSVVGRCCESGDIIQEKVPMPASVCRGDIIACLTTGAYNYSMASNYNRIPRPPVVMLSNGESYMAVRRETVEDLVALDV